jgi:hypothetical protein
LEIKPFPAFKMLFQDDISNCLGIEYSAPFVVDRASKLHSAGTSRSKDFDNQK